MPIIRRREKTAVLGAIKAQLPLSEGKYHPLNLWNKISFLQFSIIRIFSYHIRTDQIVLARRNIPLKCHKTLRESGKLHSKPFPCFFLVGCPCILTPHAKRPPAHSRGWLLNRGLTVILSLTNIQVVAC